MDSQFVPGDTADSAALDSSELLLAIEADCPGCGHRERTFNPATGCYGCTRCTYVSPERDA